MSRPLRVEYPCRLLRGDRLHELGREFSVKRYKSVSTAIHRTKTEISRDRKLRQREEKLEAALTTSQT